MFSRVRRASGGVGWVGVVHVLQGRRASGGVGWVGGVGEVIVFVGTFTHIPYYIFARVRRTFLCRFEPDQKRMSSDTLGSSVPVYLLRAVFFKLFVFPRSVLLSFSTFLVLGTFELPVFSNQSSHPLGQGMRTCLNPMAQGTTN